MRFCSERSEEVQPTMARPLARVTGYGQAPCRGGHPRPGRLQEQPVTAKAPCNGRLDARKRSPAKGSSLQAVDHKDSSPQATVVGAVAARRHDRLRLTCKGGNHPWAQPLAAWHQ
ncbi:hypothetical protein BHM03_00051722 [Ensete ventricosum]|nr:hypothetical protein BHM03_00051722 [Ensete ventricosum]